ncbi:MAG TPA: TolC family outer membrane protein [Caulobacteraceae bacterium]
MRGRLTAAACGAALCAAAGASAAETLADAIALAYQTNPTLAAQRANLRFIEEGIVQARAGLRPSVNAQVSGEYQRLGARTGQLGNTTPAQETQQASAQLNFSQPLYTGGRVTAQTRSAEADTLSERETLRQTEADVVQQVIQAYVNVRRDLQALAIRRENVEILQRQVRETRIRFEAGEVTKTDVAQSEAQLAQSQAQLANAQAQLALSRAAYANVVGQSPGELAPEPPLKLPATIEQAFDRAQEFNPQIRSAEYSRQSAVAQLAQAKAARRPSVSLNGSVGYTGSRAQPFTGGLDSSAFFDFTQATVTLTQPLFSGGAISSQIRQAVERENFFRTQLEGARRNTVQQLSQGWNQLLAARASIAAGEEQVRAARIAFEGAQAEQAVGLRTTLEVLTAQQVLRDAELALVTARRDEYVAAALVLNETGQLAAANIVADLPQEPRGHEFERLQKTTGYVPWEEALNRIDQLYDPADLKELPPAPDEPLVLAPRDAAANPPPPTSAPPPPVQNLTPSARPRTLPVPSDAAAAPLAPAGGAAPTTTTQRPAVTVQSARPQAPAQPRPTVATPPPARPSNQAPLPPGYRPTPDPNVVITLPPQSGQTTPPTTPPR